MQFIIILLVLSLVIVLHELGHFLVAKFYRLYVEQFAIGFGPKLLALKKGETEYRINIIPFGGYVMLASESDSKYNKIASKRKIESLTPLQNIILVLAGPLMNLILGFILFFIVYLINDFAIIKGLSWAIIKTGESSITIFQAVINLFSGSQPLDNVGGPVAIISSGQQILNQGIRIFLYWTAWISINLFVVNLLPIPPFDGQKIFLSFYELCMNKKIPQRIINLWTKISLVFLLWFFIFITGNDIMKLFK